MTAPPSVQGAAKILVDGGFLRGADICKVLPRNCGNAL